MKVEQAMVARLAHENHFINVEHVFVRQFPKRIKHHEFKKSLQFLDEFLKNRLPVKNQIRIFD